MGFRFRKSFKIFPGVRVNMGKGGFTSVSVGGRGLTYNVNKKGKKRITAGIPGTGMSYSEEIGDDNRGEENATSQAQQPEAEGSWSPLFWLAAIVIGLVYLFR